MPDFSPLCGTLLTPETVNDTDFPIAAIKLDDIQRRQADAVPSSGRIRPHIAVHQLDLAPHGAVSCFYSAAFACAADAWELSKDDRPRAVKAWRAGWSKIVADGKVTAGFGGRMADGVDYARRAWNAEFTDRKVKSLRGDINTDPGFHCFVRCLANGWKVTIGRFVGKDEHQDIITDGIVDDNFKEAGDYGHLTGYFSKSASKDAVQDQYPKMAGFPNIHELADFQTKLANGVIFPSFYVFLRA